MQCVSIKTVPYPFIVWQMLIDFQSFLLSYFPQNLQQNPCHVSRHTLKVLLHYLAKHKKAKLAKFCCTQHNHSCLMFTKLTNMIDKIKYALYEVRLIKCSKFHIFTLWWHFAQNHVRHQSNTASVHRRHELGRPAAAFLPICVINDAGDKWRQRLYVGIRVKVRNFEHLI